MLTEEEEKTLSKLYKILKSASVAWRISLYSFILVFFEGIMAPIFIKFSDNATTNLVIPSLFFAIGIVYLNSTILFLIQFFKLESLYKSKHWESVIEKANERVKATTPGDIDTYTIFTLSNEKVACKTYGNVSVRERLRTTTITIIFKSRLRAELDRINRIANVFSIELDERGNIESEEDKYVIK